MKEIKVFSTDLKDDFKKSLVQIIHNFDTIEGGEGKRNVLKKVNIDNASLNIKAFKIPNIVNQIAYNFLRKSKAQRSFEYANKLVDLNVGTPRPFAYFEYRTFLLFKKSFYVSEQLESDLTYRELIMDLNYPDHENILRAFTRFTFSLHEKNIRFLDHSPGNTLIRKEGDSYSFYLVDLNRMSFEPLDFESRIKNFERLSTEKSIIEVMSDEYAKCSSEDYNKIYNLMWKSSIDFDRRLYRRRDLKEKFLGRD